MLCPKIYCRCGRTRSYFFTTKNPVIELHRSFLSKNIFQKCEDLHGGSTSDDFASYIKCNNQHGKRKRSSIT